MADDQLLECLTNVYNVLQTLEGTLLTSAIHSTEDFLAKAYLKNSTVIMSRLDGPPAKILRFPSSRALLSQSKVLPSIEADE